MDSSHAKAFRAVLYFQDIFYTLQSNMDDPAQFLQMSDEQLVDVFKREIQDIIQSNLGMVKAVRVGGKLSGDGWAYVEYFVDGEHYHVGPRVFVYEHPKYSAQTVVMKSYEEEKKSLLK